jgi:thiol-disulfide isomerase/thioredoxin
MKKQNILIILFIITLLLSSACKNTTNNQNDEKTIGNPGVNSFISTDIAGETIDQTIFGNHKITLVNIWATFCGPCIDEMPDLAKLNEDYADQGFQVVGIVADAQEGNATEIEAALSIVAQTGATYTHILASESLKEAKLRSVQYVPETIFVDASGNQIGESYVGSKNYKNWSKIIESLLNEVE